MNSQSAPLSFVDSGKGPILVLLHGFLESHTMWEKLQLDQQLRTIAIDLPGHGNSTEHTETTSLEEMAIRVKNTLDTLNIQDFHLIGHSMGGYVLLEFLQLFGCNGKVILLNSNFWQDDEKKQADRLRVANLALKNKTLFIQEAIPGLFSKPKEHKSEIDILISEAKKIDSGHIAASSIAMRNRKNHAKTVKKWSKKISILQGETDKLCPPERMEKEVAGLEISYTCIPDAGHMSHIENGNFVCNKILNFLNESD